MFPEAYDTSIRWLNEGSRSRQLVVFLNRMRESAALLLLSNRYTPGAFNMFVYYLRKTHESDLEKRLLTIGFYAQYWLLQSSAVRCRISLYIYTIVYIYKGYRG